VGQRQEIVLSGHTDPEERRQTNNGNWLMQSRLVNIICVANEHDVCPSVCLFTTAAEHLVSI